MSVPNACTDSPACELYSRFPKPTDKKLLKGTPLCPKMLHGQETVYKGTP